MVRRKIGGTRFVALERDDVMSGQRKHVQTFNNRVHGDMCNHGRNEMNETLKGLFVHARVNHQ